MKRPLIIAGAFCLVLLCVAVFFRQQAQRTDLQLSDQVIPLAIARTSATQQRGLAGQAVSLDNPHGMLFVFANGSRPTIWMQGMISAIDIIWLQDTTVVGITPNVAPEPGVATKDLQLYPAPARVNQVIELPAGSAAAFGIRVGDQLAF